jgi:flagellar protein FlaJ
LCPLYNDFEGWSHRLFGNVATKFLAKVFELKPQLEKAEIKIYPETYISMMIFASILTLPVTVISLVLLYFTKIIPLIFLVPLPIYIMIIFMILPSMKAGERATALEREMPFASAYITVMASGGISPYMSVKRLSKVDLMPSMRKEAREIMRDVEVFGIDPLSALEHASETHPLDVYKDFMSGYASTVITGGDTGHFLENKTHDIFKSRALRMKAAAERLGMLLESFIIVVVLMSLCFYILFSVDAIYSTGASMYSTMMMYTFIFAPMLSVIFIYLAHDMQPKTPINDWRPYKVAAASTAVAAVIFFFLNGLFGLIQGFPTFADLPTSISIALVVMCVPPAIVHSKLASKKADIERGIASFLRDLTEIRKTGMAPEKCIENLAKRNYGAFTKELEKISSQLSWGVPVKRVFQEFMKRTKSWLSQVVVFLLVEAIDVGGGTIGMLESLTRFNNMTQDVEKEKRMNSRPYIIMPYFAGIMLMATTVMLLMFLGKTVGLATTGMGAQVDLAGTSMIFTVSVIVHVFMIGLVAGKIGEESIAAGFKHSALLVIIALMASIIIPQIGIF